MLALSLFKRATYHFAAPGLTSRCGAATQESFYPSKKLGTLNVPIAEPSTF